MGRSEVCPCWLQIYQEYILAGKEIPATEVICILDADQAVHMDFFLRTVHLLDGNVRLGADDVAMVRQTSHRSSQRLPPHGT